jgi:hypothetical protein
VKFLALDWLLGEDTVEIWLGRIAVTTEPGPALTATELAAVVASQIPPDGKLPWRNVAGTRAGRALDELYALEDRLYQHADGAVLVAHEMSDGLWTDHFYADRQAAAEALRPLVTAWPHGPVRITTTPDAKWSAVAHLAR